MLLRVIWKFLARTIEALGPQTRASLEEAAWKGGCKQDCLRHLLGLADLGQALFQILVVLFL